MARWMIFLFLGGFACGAILKDNRKAPGNRRHNTSDETFAPFILSFEEAGKARGLNVKVVDIPINFDEPGKRLVGSCLSYHNGEKEIFIRKSWWEQYTDHYARESLIFHELGHCRLGREHRKGKTKSLHSSLMSSYIVSGQVYKKYRDAYLTELFTQSLSALEEATGRPAQSDPPPPSRDGQTNSGGS